MQPWIWLGIAYIIFCTALTIDGACQQKKNMLQCRTKKFNVLPEQADQNLFIQRFG